MLVVERMNGCGKSGNSFVWWEFRFSTPNTIHVCHISSKVMIARCDSCQRLCASSQNEMNASRRAAGRMAHRVMAAFTCFSSICRAKRKEEEEDEKKALALDDTHLPFSHRYHCRRRQRQPGQWNFKWVSYNLRTNLFLLLVVFPFVQLFGSGVRFSNCFSAGWKGDHQHTHNIPTRIVDFYTKKKLVHRFLPFFFMLTLPFLAHSGRFRCCGMYSTVSIYILHAHRTRKHTHTHTYWGLCYG